jgi:hypothetical protein
VLDLLIEKKNYFQKQLLITSDAEVKFSLQQKLKELEKEISSINGIQPLNKTETMLDTFKQYYAESIEKLKHLKTDVKKTELMSFEDYFNACFHLYSEYVTIYTRYNQYTKENLGVDLKFVSYTRNITVSTDLVYKNQIDILKSEILKLREFLLNLNNPNNKDGLYRTVVDLKDLKEEKKYLELFKQFITALQKQELVAYDLFENLDNSVLLNEVIDFNIKSAIKTFWSEVDKKHKSEVDKKHKEASGLGKKKLFVESCVKTQEITQNLNYLISNLIKIRC